MTLGAFARGLLAAGGLTILVLLPPGGVQSYTLNGPLPIAFNGAVEPGFEFTSDGSRVVYRAAAETQDFSAPGGTVELYSAPSDGSAGPVRLNHDLGTSSTYPGIHSFQITPDGSRVVYDVRVAQLYSVPTDGSAPAVAITASLPLPSLAAFDYRISPDGTRVAYLDHGPIYPSVELYIVPIDGSGSPIRLSAPLVAGGSVQTGFRFSPDGSRVVYIADQDTDQDFELYSVPSDGSAAPTRLNGNLVTGGDVVDFEITPDGTRVAYRARENSTRVAAYSAPIDGSAPRIQLSATPVPGGAITQIRISADSSRVVYRGDQDTDGVYELYSVPVDGSLPWTRLNDPIVAGGIVRVAFEISGDSSRVVYLADQITDDQNELFSVPIDGSSGSTTLNDALVPGGQVLSFEISPDSSQVVYDASQDTAGMPEVYVVPIDGTLGSTKLSGTLVAGGGTADFRVSPDGSRVVYRASQDTAGVLELYAVPIDGSLAPAKLNDPLVSGGDVSGAYEIDPASGQVVYIADEVTDETFEIFTVPLSIGPPAVKLNLPLLPVTAGAVVHFEITLDGTRVVYVADQETDEVFEIYSVPLDGSQPPVRLNGDLVTGGDVSPNGPLFAGFEISADGSRVVYRADQDTDNVFELYGVPSDGSLPPQRLNGDPVAGGDVSTVFRISPDGSRVVYHADQDVDERFELFSVPSDGSLPPQRLNGSLVAGGDVSTNIGYGSGFEIGPDGDRVVYLADQDTNGVTELYGVPSDASAAPIRLSEPLVPGGDVLAFQIAPDGTRVVYVADQDTDQDFELYSVPSDGSAGAIKLSGTQGGNGVRPDFLVSPDSSRVVYVADPDTVGTFEIFSAPLDGSAAPVKLNGPLVPEGDVATQDEFPFAIPDGFRISPDSARVVYLADQAADARYELFSAPLDGSAAAVRLNPPLTGTQSITEFDIAADSAHVAYLANPAPAVLEVSSVPIEGGASTLLIPSSLGIADGLRIGPRGSRVVCRSSFRLYSVPIDGARPPVELSTTNGVGLLYRFSSDLGKVAFLEDGELRVSFIEPLISGLAPDQGSSLGGNVVTISGDGFSLNTRVAFGGRPATSVTWISSTRLDVVVPPRRVPPTTGPASGKIRQGRIEGLTVDVTVSEDSFTDTLAGAYTYFPTVVR